MSSSRSTAVLMFKFCTSHDFFLSPYVKRLHKRRLSSPKSLTILNSSYHQWIFISSLKQKGDTWLYIWKLVIYSTHQCVLPVVGRCHQQSLRSSENRTKLDLDRSSNNCQTASEQWKCVESTPSTSLLLLGDPAEPVLWQCGDGTLSHGKKMSPDSSELQFLYMSLIRDRRGASLPCPGWHLEMERFFACCGSSFFFFFSFPQEPLVSKDSE